MIADHTRDDSMGALAKRILDTTPPRFAVVGHSMGGYVAFAIMRQASGRITKLALINTTARADAEEIRERRRKDAALARTGKFPKLVHLQYERLVHPSRHDDEALRREVELMAKDAGAEGLVRQQTAIMGRSDSMSVPAATRCPTLVVAGDSEALIPPARSVKIAQGITSARLAVVERCGHLSALERPSEKTQLLVDWLSTGSNRAVSDHNGRPSS